MSPTHSAGDIQISICGDAPTGNSCLSGRQKSIHHWALPIRYRCANFSLSFRYAPHHIAFPLRGRWHGASRDG